MTISQNTTSFALLFAVTLSILSSTGCKMGAFPKMPEMPFLKKDSFKLSRSNNDTVAPPSRTFDPKPSHFATLDSGDDRSSGQMASNDARPIRKPYDVDAGEQASANDSFGFPNNSKSLTGNNEFKMPAADQLRQAMDNTTEKAQGFAASTQQAASETFKNAQDFVANKSNDFAPRSSVGNGSFAPKQNQDFLNESAAIARNVTQNQSGNNQPKWKDDFSLPQQTAPKSNSMANRLGGSDFKASVQKATDDVRKSVTDFNQNALNRVNDGFRATQQAAGDVVQKTQDSINGAGQQFAAAKGQFEQSWQNTVEQARMGANAIRNANTLTQNTPNLQPSIPGDFRPANTQVQPIVSPNNNLQQQANQNVKPALPVQRSIEVTPEVEYARTPAGNPQFASTQGNAFQTSPSQQIGTPSSVAQQPAGSNRGFVANPTLVNDRQTNSPYPSTNFNSYVNAGREQVSQVTPIAEPNSPANRNPAASGISSGPRTANLPSELLRGNSNYAPGSVKQLTPLK